MGRAKGSNGGSPYYSTVKSNANVPSKIKCCRCNIVKNPQAFANKRLEDLKLKISKDKSFNAERQGHIACAQCTGAQVTELFCNGCDKWKGLDSFAKAQRKIPDKAKCWKCMDEQLTTEPGASSSEGGSGSGGEESDSDESYAGGTTVGGTLPGTFSNMSITNGTSTPGGVALASDTASKGSVAIPPHLRRGPASVTSSNNSNFAKVPRAPPRQIYSELGLRERQRDKEAEETDVGAASSDTDDDDD